MNTALQNELNLEIARAARKAAKQGRLLEKAEMAIRTQLLLLNEEAELSPIGLNRAREKSRQELQDAYASIILAKPQTTDQITAKQQ